MKRITTITFALAVTWLVSCSTKESAQEEVTQNDTTASVTLLAEKDNGHDAARQGDSVSRANMKVVASLLYDKDLFPEKEIADKIQQLHRQGMEFIREEHRILFVDSSHYRLCQIRVGNIFNTAAYNDAVILLYENFIPRMILYNDSTKLFRFVPDDIKVVTVSRTHANDATIPDAAAEIPDDFLNYRFPASLELKNGVISLELLGGAKFTSAEITYDKGKDVLRSKEVFVFDEHE